MAVACEFCGADTEWLSTGQGARIAGITSRTMQAWISEGRFSSAEKVMVRGSWTWRIRASEIMPVIEERDRQIAKIRKVKPGGPKTWMGRPLVPEEEEEG